MNTKHHLETIGQLLLLPFTETDFDKRDLLVEKAFCYRQLCRKRDMESAKEYEESKQRILNYFSKKPYINHLDDVELILEMFYNNGAFKEYYRQSKEDMAFYYLRKVLDIASQFITFRDGILSIRTTEDSHTEDLFNKYTGFKKVELWNTLSRMATSDLFIAAHYINSGITQVEYLMSAPTFLDYGDIMLRRVTEKGLAETHFHFNAGIPYHFHWEQEMNLLVNRKIKDRYKALSIFRFIFSKFLEKTLYLQEDGGHETPTDLYGYLTDSSHNGSIFIDITMKLCGEAISFSSEENLHIDQYLSLSQYEMDREKEGGDLLSYTVFKRWQGLHITSELIFLYLALRYFTSDKGNRDSFALKRFLTYIRYKNAYYRNKFQSNQIGGLLFFQEKYDQATHLHGYSTPEDHLKVYPSIFFEQCKNLHLKKLEIKIKPRLLSQTDNDAYALRELKRNILRDISGILKGYEGYLEYAGKARLNPVDNTFSFPSVGIVYHFIKKRGADNYSGRTCLFERDDGSVNEADSYYAMRKQAVAFIQALNELILNNPVLSEYIVGIDAASLEHATEPWVFAPVFKFARNRKTTLPIDPKSHKAIQNLGFTYHVGEEFRHILSGLRHIDEVLEHYGYCSGDRLGHAIALGVDVKKLVRNNTIVCLPIMEYLENLLWLWGFMKEGKTELSADNLEYNILRTAEKIYGREFNTMTVFLLRQVYEAKFDFYEPDGRALRFKSHAFKKGNFCVKGDRPWQLESLLCTHFCPCWFEAYNKPLFVEIKDDEIELIEKLQAMLIDKIEKRGVYVETNPTSNTAIGDIDRIYSHPIIRLNNQGLESCATEKQISSVLITINSDDPIVFCTNVENEFAIVYHALINAGYRRENVLAWMDKIRQNGMDSSFIKKVKSVEEIKRDIKKIREIYEAFS